MPSAGVREKVTGQDVETFAGSAGYYRLAFGGEETSCIGYHASEETVEASTVGGGDWGRGSMCSVTETS